MSSELSVSERVCAAKLDLGPVPKSAYNQHGKYNYASVDDVYHAVRPVMGKHGLDLHIDLTERAIVESAKGTPWVHLTALVWLDGDAAKVTRYLALPLTGPQTFEAAVSYFAKQFLRQRLEIETGEYDEADMPKETPPQPAAAPPEPAPPPVSGRWVRGEDGAYAWDGEGEPDDAGWRELYAILALAMQPRDWMLEEAVAAHRTAEANRGLIGKLPDAGRSKIEEMWAALPEGAK